jgi:ABC-type transporter Mla maintaining outer membrane lipid asymmetry ATPase subunit MlaF
VGIQDVNWTVRPGEFWVIAGMHDSGKSDFLTLTAGLMPPREGAYQLFGHDMAGDGTIPLSLRLRLGLVFEGGRLLHDLTVVENVALPLLYHHHLDANAVQQRAEGLLALTGLSEWADASPGDLPLKVLKRGGLARALMLKPEILLLDNPLGGLDPREIAWWLDFLGALWAGHPFFDGHRLTMVVTTNDLRVWRRRCSHYALLKDKRFVVLGDESQMTGNTDLLVKEFLAEASAGP